MMLTWGTRDPWLSMAAAAYHFVALAFPQERRRMRYSAVGNLGCRGILRRSGGPAGGMNRRLGMGETSRPPSGIGNIQEMRPEQELGGPQSGLADTSY